MTLDDLRWILTGLLGILMTIVSFVMKNIKDEIKDIKSGCVLHKDRTTDNSIHIAALTANIAGMREDLSYVRARLDLVLPAVMPERKK